MKNIILKVISVVFVLFLLSMFFFHPTGPDSLGYGLNFLLVWVIIAIAYFLILFIVFNKTRLDFVDKALLLFVVLLNILSFLI